MDYRINLIWGIVCYLIILYHLIFNWENMDNYIMWGLILILALIGEINFYVGKKKIN